MLQQLILILHIVVSFIIIALILSQHGRGAEIGAMFENTNSQVIFGNYGAGLFLTKLTGMLAIIFAITSISLSAISSQSLKSPSILKELKDKGFIQSKDNDILSTIPK